MNYIGNKEKLRRSNQKIVYLKKELEKKDKIIDLMAEKINQAYFEEDDFYEWFEKMLGVQKQIDYGYVVDLIKQYFNQKIEKGE